MIERRYEDILFERKGRVLTITLNRPEALNGFDARMHRELAWLFDDAVEDPDSDVIVLTGAGRAFSAGGDLGFIDACREDPALFRHAMREGRKTVSAILDCDKPVICRMNGDAVGLGATVALFCDIVIAADHARIGDPHVKVGFAAGDGGAVIWPQLVGYARAKQYLLTGDLMTAPEAASIGLINFAVPAEELDATVEKWAGRLAAGASLAQRATKLALNVNLKRIAAGTMETGLAYEGLLGRSEDHAEAIAAMREKRKPAFRGR